MATDLDSTGDYYYDRAIEAVTKIRSSRKAQYGNSWMEMEPWETTAMVLQKARRLKAIVIDKKESNYEGVKDCCIDSINWCLFMLANEMRRNETDYETTR